MRGFKEIIGNKIVGINAKAVNQVVLVSEDGTEFIIDAEVVDQIPYIRMSKVKPVVVIPEPPPIVEEAKPAKKKSSRSSSKKK